MDFSDTSDVLSAIAIIVSLGSAAYQWYLDTRMNKINLEADYFKTLYSEHLLYKIPKARAYIHFQNGKLCDIDSMLDALNAVRQDSLYFMFTDYDFYTNIKIQLQNLEDFLVEKAEKELDIDEQERVLRQIEIKLEIIYKIFNDKYVGN